MQYRAKLHARRALGSCLLLGGALALAACGGGGGSASGSLTVGITDAKVDQAEQVNVVFTAITLKPQSGEPITFECDEPAGEPDFDCGGLGYREIDLLALGGDKSETVLDAVELAAGRYNWIRLEVNAGTPGSPAATDSTIPESTIVLELDPFGSEPLLIPSGQQSGLKLVSGFEVPNGGSASFTIDFDLRKAVTLTNAGGTERYLLRPALRLVDNTEAGHLVGEITNEFVQTTCLDLDSDGNGDATGGLAVYLYEGADATTGDLGDPDHEPLTTDEAEMDPADGNFDYRIGFLEAGVYRAAVTCQSDSDDEDLDEELTFVATENVTVEAGNQPTRQDFDVTP